MGEGEGADERSSRGSVLKEGLTTQRHNSQNNLVNLNGKFAVNGCVPKCSGSER